MPFGIDFWTPNIIQKAPKFKVQGDSAVPWVPEQREVSLRVALGTDFKRFAFDSCTIWEQLFDTFFGSCVLYFR